MSYETHIGWRFLHQGRTSRTVVAGLILSGLLLIAGASLFWNDPSPLGVLLLSLGMLGGLTFSVLSLFSVFVTVSVAGIVLGVAALVVVLGVTSGFHEQFRDKILGVNAHVLVMKSSMDFSNYRDVEEMARNLPHVLAVQPFTFEEMLVTRGTGEISGVAIKGVDPERIGTVLDLPKHMIEGSVETLAQHVPGQPPPTIIGRELATKLRAKVGDEVTVVSPLSGVYLGDIGGRKPPRSRRFVIRGIFYSGFEEYDRRLMYIDLEESKDFLDQGDVVRGVEMKLDDVHKAKEVAMRLEQQLGEGEFVVMDWRKLNDNLFRALWTQKLALFVLLVLIVVQAAFNLVSSLMMMVVDKTREIAILKSMGASDRGVARIFQIVGLTIGGAGTLMGVGFGLFLCWAIARYGYPLDPQVYLIDQLPVKVNPDEVLLIAGVTLVISLASAWFPALGASRLRPVEGLRYD